MIIYNLNLFGQITFPQILSLEDKPYKDIQGFFYNDHSIISQTTNYFYTPHKECNPPKYREDGCEWKCFNGVFGSFDSNYRTTQPNFSDTSIKNYTESIVHKTNYGENYNSETKTATTFIEISDGEVWGNTNCKNEFKFIRKSNINFYIQFNDFNHWNNFKKSVLKNSQFQSVWDPNIEGMAPRMRFGIRRKKGYNGQWKGVYIQLIEGNKSNVAMIDFNSYGVE